MYTLRTRFAKDIVSEFLPPARPTKKQRVIILLDGAPSVPSKKSLIEYLSKKGFWVFHPRYRGTWESDGKFLQYSLEKDVIDVIDGIHNGFVDLWNNKKMKLKPDSVYLVGGSFGGPAGIFAASDRRVTKSIVISPMIDWTKPTRIEPIEFLEKFIATAYGNGYRVDKKGWAKIKSGKFYNPATYNKNIANYKILFIHAKDDEICSYAHTKKFAMQIGANLATVAKGGHFGASILLKPRFYKLFQNFTKTGKVKK